MHMFIEREDKDRSGSGMSMARAFCSPLRAFLSRIRHRKSGREEDVANLAQHVKACSYHDIQVMWSILHNNLETELTRPPSK